ncbi:MAG: tail fiber domain-containing protein, partial [Lentimicrobium sp.]|nr:tail fiber domain-containing protein [Lentimicrobium sp.]
MLAFSVSPTISQASAILNFSSSTGVKTIQTGGLSHLNLAPGGNVGIGTSVPGQKLDVNGNVKATTFFGNLSGNATTATSLAANGNNCSAGYFPLGVDASGNVEFCTAAGGGGGSLPSGTAGQTIRNNGTTNWVVDSNLYNNGANVGIGTTAPGLYKLRVAGTVAAVSFIYDSDINLKKNVQTLEHSLDKILALRGVSFNWRDTNQKSLGLIAQEVEKVYPELVTTSNGSKAVQYGNLIAPLIEAIKAQQAQITALEARIRSLEKGN